MGRGMSPRKMKGMLKSMGIDIEELEGVKEVVIKTAEREILIENPSVAIMEAHGTRTYQISGEAVERPLLLIPDADVELVAAQTGAKPEEARAALEAARGDLAEAIVKLGQRGSALPEPGSR
jgi:nascent polypeptide-associated complex subunit alpha